MPDWWGTLVLALLAMALASAIAGLIVWFGGMRDD